MELSLRIESDVISESSLDLFKVDEIHREDSNAGVMDANSGIACVASSVPVPPGRQARGDRRA
jgi:hypothetical protein